MSVFRGTAAIAVVLSGLVMTGAGPSYANAYRYRWCEKRIDEAKANLRSAIRTYGVDSPEADYRRRALSELRERCSNYSRGGNEERRQWQEYEKHAEREEREHHD